MTAPTREEMMDMARAAEALKGHRNDYFAFSNGELERFAALLSAHQAQGEPAKPYAYEYGHNNGDGTYSVKIHCGELPSYITPHKDWPVKALYAAPPSSAQTDQVKGDCKQCPHAVGDAYERDCAYPDCMQSASSAAQSGAVDDLQNNWAHEALLLMDDADSLIRFGCTHAPKERYDPAAKAFWSVCDLLAKERDRLSRAQTAPAIDLASVSDEREEVEPSPEILSSLDKVLSRPSAPAPVSEQPAANEPKPCRACDDSVGYVCEEHGEQPAAQTAIVPGYEHRRAIMEGERNAACDEYFKARPQIAFIGNRRIFEAGFDRGFAAAPQPVAEHVGEYSATEQLSELLRGLEAGPECGAWPPTVLHKMGKAIAEQAKLSAGHTQAAQAKSEDWRSHVCEVVRTSDQSVKLIFPSCRTASLCENALKAQAKESGNG